MAIAAVVILIAGAGALAFVLLRGSDNATHSFTATGTFDLEGSPTDYLGDGAYDVSYGQCSGADGYDDISKGTQVTVSDESDKTLAVGQLGAGISISGACEFTLTVRNVPTGHKFYRVSVSHRGEIQFTAKQMQDGKIALSLGD